MNVLRLISQLIGIETLRLTKLTVVGETAKYKEIVSPCWERLNNGGDVRYILSSSNDF